MRRDFFRMFPVTKANTKIKTKFSYTDDEGQKKEIEAIRGSCRKSDGVVIDFIDLHNKMRNTGLDQVVVILNKDYQEYHNDYGWAGIHYPALPREYFIENEILYSRGERVKTHIVFVLAEELERATILHELAHSFGQLREGYESDSFINREPTQGEPHYHCSQFTPPGIKPGEEINGKREGVPCPEYRITGGLFQQGIRTWKLLNNQKSILGSSGGFITRKRSGKEIYRQWIDRETYNKALDTIKEGRVNNDFLNRKTLELEGITSSNDSVLQTFGNKITCNLQKRPVIKVSGIYNKKTSRVENLTVKTKFMDSKNIKSSYRDNKFSIVNPEDDIKKLSDLKEYVKIQLKKEINSKEYIINERVIEAKFYAEYSYKNRSEHKEQSLIPIYTEFFLTCGFFDKDMFISIQDEDDKPLAKQNIK